MASSGINQSFIIFFFSLISHFQFIFSRFRSSNFNFLKFIFCFVNHSCNYYHYHHFMLDS
jgi:hypothetical protein